MRNVIKPREAGPAGRLEQHTIASGARQLAKPRRNSGRVVLRRIGWRATPEAVVITIAEQELRSRGKKRYAPSGPWLIEQRETCRHRSGKAEKRVGAVAADRAVVRATRSPRSATWNVTQAAYRFGEPQIERV